jgi:hypothetical protein
LPCRESKRENGGERRQKLTQEEVLKRGPGLAILGLTIKSIEGYFFFDDDFLAVDFFAAGFFLAATEFHPRSILCVHDLQSGFYDATFG